MHLDATMGWTKKTMFWFWSIDSISFSEQAPLLTCKAHVFQVDPDTRKTWIPLSIGAGMKSKRYENYF